MIHLRRDYTASIQDTSGDVGGTEPVFLLRGRDRATPHALRAWVEAARAMGTDPVVCDRVAEWAAHIEGWQRMYGSDSPTIPRDLLLEIN